MCLLNVSFEDQFRGTREDIKERQKVYLPYIEQVMQQTGGGEILDMGCGRGEWLELLNEEGFTARGVDFNRVLVEQCRERGIDVVESDVFEYLHTLPDAGLGAVTGLHIIEHLPLGALIKLIDETIRVLKPGGLAIFETPNPENILVGACTFYFDPTHCNPLPPLMIKFLVESRGLCQVEIKRLHPYDTASRVPDNSSELAKRFNEYFYGPQDYAVIGVKP
jgi:O-antigen chain-terminating methyltransferase